MDKGCGEGHRSEGEECGSLVEKPCSGVRCNGCKSRALYWKRRQLKEETRQGQEGGGAGGGGGGSGGEKVLSLSCLCVVCCVVCSV